MATTTPATNNAISILEKSLAAAKPGSKEQTQISLALFDLKKSNKDKEEASSKTNAANKKDNVSTGGGEAFVDKNKRIHNPLGDYSSSTYRISLYMITPDAMNGYSETGLWDLKSMVIIAQSGGVNEGVDAPRSPFFGLDLYIDNLDIITVIDNKDLGVSTTSFDFRFQIIEPYGINFTNNLLAAATYLQQQTNIKKNLSQPVNALTMTYMLAVHFYGYDSEGNITSGSAMDSASSNGVSKGAAFQRLFPIQFIKMSTRLENKNATYDITANMFNHQVAYSKTRGAIPDSTTVAAGTVKEALDALSASLNKKQKLISGPNKGQLIPDEYEFKFTDDDIAQSTIVDKNHFVVSNTPMPDALSPLNVNVRLSDSGKAAKIAKQSRQLQFAVGTPLMGAIDQVITQSSYLRNVLATVDKEELEKVHYNEKGFVTNANPKPLAWYHVTPQVSIKDFDSARQQYAFKITYIIQRKEVPYIRSAAVSKTTPYLGPYKRYDYWYTGKNSEILSYEQTYNLTYYNPDAASSEAEKAHTDSAAPSKKMASAGVGSTGSQPGSNAKVDTIRTSMYSPGDQINARIKILGDPDFIMTSEAGAVREKGKFYGDDYAINPASGQVFIEIGFNQVKDYDSDLGTLTTDNNIFFWNYSKEVKAVSGNRMIYQVLIVKSKFSRGMFTQELTTSLPPFSDDTSATANPDQRSESKTKSVIIKPQAKLEALYKQQLALGQTAAAKVVANIPTVNPDDENVKSVIVKSPSALNLGGREPVKSVIRKTN